MFFVVWLVVMVSLNSAILLLMLFFSLFQYDYSWLLMKAITMLFVV